MPATSPPGGRGDGSEWWNGHGDGCTVGEWGAGLHLTRLQRGLTRRVARDGLEGQQDVEVRAGE